MKASFPRLTFLGNEAVGGIFPLITPSVTMKVVQT